MSTKFRIGDRVQFQGISGYLYGTVRSNNAIILNETGGYYSESELELVKEEPKMKEWPCEHICFSNAETYKGWINSNTCQFIEKTTLFCKYCGAKRPEPKEETWEKILSDAYISTPISEQPVKHQSKAIREHLKSKEGEITNLITEWKLSPGSQVASKLAKQILKVLGVE